MTYNILVIGIETCRKDAFQCYDPRRNTPFIQKFAERSLVFDNYYTSATNTYQSWGCFYSGKHARNSGIAVLPKDKISVKLIDEILYGNEYYTEWSGDSPVVGYKIMGSEISYVNKRRDFCEPFFIFDGYLNAHWPYGLSFDDVEKLEYTDQLLDAHYKRVEKLDTQFQDIINKFSIYKNTIIILVSDHGENMRGHGQCSHHDNLEDCTSNVPLIIYHPQIKPRRIEDLFSSVDILPTMLGFCGIQHSYKFDGQDMSKHLLQNISFPDRMIQLGPNVGCEEIRTLHWESGSQSITHKCHIKKYQYSRKEALMRYKDYKNRIYVNELFAGLDKSGYFKDEWVKRSEIYDNLGYARHTPYVDKIIEKLDLRDNLKIVDAGAGTGMITKAIVGNINNKNLKDIEIYAIDQCYSMLDKCPENVAIKKFIADVGYLAFVPDNSIDRIVCSMMLHSEFENANDVVKEFHRILKKGGILILAEGVPMDDSLLEFYKSFLLKKEKRDVFTKQKLIDILSADFGNIDLSEIVLKSQSIKNWLDNSCIEEKLAKGIMDIHINADQDTKEKMMMVTKDNDVLCDWKYVIAKCMK